MRVVRNLLGRSVLVLLSAAAVMAQSVQTDYDRTFNLSKLRTYSFVNSNVDHAIHWRRVWFGPNSALLCGAVPLWFNHASEKNNHRDTEPQRRGIVFSGTSSPDRFQGRMLGVQSRRGPVR